MGTKRFLVTEDEKREIMSLYNYKGLLQEQKNQLNEGDIDWGEVTQDAAVGGTLLLVPGVIIGASYSLIKQWYNSGGSRTATRKLLEGCKSKGVGKSTIPDSTINYVVKNLYNAMEENTAIPIFGATDEEGIKRGLEALRTIPDVCKTEKLYKQNHPGATLFGDLDGEFHDDAEWNEYVWEPLAQAFRNSEAENEKNYRDKLKSKKEKLQKTARECGYFTDAAYKAAGWKCPSQLLLNAKKCGWKTIEEYKLQDWKCPSATPQEKEIIKKETQKIIYRDRDPGGGGKTYKDCTETYVKGCKSAMIRKVQVCLGIGADGKMGPKTVSAISAKIGRSYFTDADVEKLCGGSTPKPKSEFDDDLPTEDGTKIEQPKTDQAEFGGEEY